MNQIKDLEYKNFIELLDYLENLSGSDEEDIRKAFMEERIHNFFPTLTALQELEFSHVVNTRNEQSFEKFKQDYPDLKVDSDGKSTPIEKNYWEIKERAVKSIYDLAENNLKENSFKDESPNKVNSQVHNARSLSCLLNRDFGEPKAYVFSRKLFIDKFPNENFISFEKFTEIEKILSDKEIDAKKFLFYVIEYCKNKKLGNFIYFLENLFTRIELLGLDKSLISEENKLFLSNVIKVVNKNN
jgi:hypothetical protein